MKKFQDMINMLNILIMSQRIIQQEWCPIPKGFISFKTKANSLILFALKIEI